MPPQMGTAQDAGTPAAPAWPLKGRCAEPGPAETTYDAIAFSGHGASLTK